MIIEIGVMSNSYDVKVIDRNSSEPEILNWASLIYIYLKDEGGKKTVEELADAYRKEILGEYDKFKKWEILETVPPRKFIAFGDSKNPIGFANIQYKVTDPNKLPVIAYFFIYVNSDYRRKGVGSQLLNFVLENMKNCPLKTIFTFAENEQSKCFLVKNNGKITEDGHLYHLVLNELDDDHFSKFKVDDEILFSYHIDPKEEVYNELVDTYNLAKQNEPGSDSFYRNTRKYSGNELYELSIQTGMKHIIALAKIDHRVVGISNLALSGNYEDRIFQKYIGVHPDFSGRGIATSLNAYIYRKLYTLYPKIEFIETETMADNISSNKVNEKLGYKMVKMQMTIEFDI